MPGLLSNPDNRRDRLQPIAMTEAEKPTHGEALGASFRASSDDIWKVQQDRRNVGYAELVRRIKERRGVGVEGHFAFNNPALAIPVYGVFADRFDGEAVWRAVGEERARDPKAFSDLPSTRDEFEKALATRQGDRAADLETLSRNQHWLTGFVGAVGAQVRDPLNLATAPIGASSASVWQAVLRESIVNAGIEIVQQPFVAQTRARMGEELTLGEAALNVGAASIFGGALGGLGYGAAKNWDAIKTAPRDVQEKLWAAVLSRSPALRKRMGSTIDWDALDDALPELADSLIANPRPEIATAKSRLAQMQSEVGASPFVDNAAGREAFRDGMAIAMRQVMDNAPVVPGRSLAPLRGDLDTSTAISTRTVAGGARDAMKRQIARVESAGDDAARNPRSSATGRYQFIDSTWLKLYGNRYGTRGQSSAEILAKRSDARLQEILMDDLLDANEQALRAGGVSPDAGNLYLAHFAGPRGAVALHRAAPDAPVATVLGQAAVRANPFLRNMTARDVIQWAHRKMGAKGPANGVANRDLRGELQADIERLGEERQRLLDDIAGEPAARAEDVIEMRMSDDAALDIAERASPLAESDGLSETANDILPDLRAIVDDYRTNLNDLDRLGNRLGVDRTDLEAALDRLVGQGELRRSKSGKVLRPLRAGERAGPSDVIGQLVQRGGIRDTEGHDLRNVGSLDHFVPGVGPLIRPKGMTIDETGEWLWEMGVFGPSSTTPRPDESAVIAWLDDVIGNRRKIDPATGREFEADSDDFVSRGYASEEDMREQRSIADSAARGLIGRELTDAEMRRLEDLDAGGFEGWRYLEDAVGPEEALEARYAAMIADMVDREVGDVLDAAYIETEDLDYDISLETQFARENAEAGQSSPGQAVDAGSARTGSSDFGELQEPPGLARLEEIPGPLSPDDYVAFDRIDGEGAQVQAESLVHDLRAAADDPNIAARQAQEAQLRAEAPLRGENVTGEAQDGTMGSPLFDAADQPQFLLDADGAGMTAREILDDLDADADMLQEIKDCL